MIENSTNANPGKIKVVNKTNRTFFVRVTSYTTRGGNVNYFIILQNGVEEWARGEENGYEGIFFSRDSRGCDVIGCMYVKNGSRVTVHDLAGLSRRTRLNNWNMRYSWCDKPIAVQNSSSEPLKVFVSSFSHSGGDESWFDIGPGRTETWNRGETELVVVTRACDFHDRRLRIGTWLNRGEQLTIGM